jgi:hypothetical protein
MDHPCHKCGNTVEDGKPFCSQCGAPQIRVALPEAASPSIAANVTASDAGAFSLDPPGLPGSLSVPMLSTGIEWPRALRTCAFAALLSVLVMSLRLMVPLLAVLGAGCLAVILYRYRSPIWKATARSGAQLGAVTGLFSSCVIAIFSAITFAVLNSGGQLREQVLEGLQQVASRSNDPQMQVFLDALKKPEGLAAKLTLYTIGAFVISVAAGSIAGALTGAFLSRKNRP